MARIAGVELRNEKRLDIALTYLYGIGRKNVLSVLAKSEIDGGRRVKTLNDEEISRISRVIEKGFTTEGDLRRQVQEHIKRLKEIGSFRGTRHVKGLPSRGQRTKTNARTRRGKRATVGALKKDDRSKVEKNTAEPEKK